MILTFEDLALRFNDRTDIKGKIRREVKAGRLTQIRRGLYETDAKADGKYLAGADNAFGVFTYRDIPAAVYSLGVQIREENGYSYQIATPEKALCDKLYALSPVGSIKAMRALLFEDLRVDEEDFWRLDLKDITRLAPLYGATNHKYLVRLIEGGR